MAASTEEVSPKAIALEFCKHVNARRFDLCAKMFSESATWDVVADTKRADWGGPVNAKQRASWAGELLAPFEEWSYNVVSATAEDDRCIVEGLSRGRGPGKCRYDNTYLMKFVVREGKIVDFKECMDCYQVEAWFASRDERQN